MVSEETGFILPLNHDQSVTFVTLKCNYRPMCRKEVLL